MALVKTMCADGGLKLNCESLYFHDVSQQYRGVKSEIECSKTALIYYKNCNISEGYE